MKVYIIMGWSPWSDGDWVVAACTTEELRDEVIAGDAAHRYAFTVELDRVPVLG